MGIHRQMPDTLRRLHPTFGTPYVGILVFAGVAILLTLPGQERFLGSIYAFGALLSFTVAHVAVIRLRVTQPDVDRPYRGPGRLRWRGHELPLFAVVGGSFTGLAFVVICALHPVVALTGVGWLALGVLAYVLYRRNQGLDLTSTHRVAIAQPATEHEAEYDSILVHMAVGDGFDPQLIATATKLAARRRRGIHLLVTIPVPSHLPIDEPLPDAEALGTSILEQARVQGGNRVRGHVVHIRAGQAGRRIIEEARAMRASAVVMALPRRVDGASLFGKTLETVLTERHCRIVIESPPAPVHERARRRRAPVRRPVGRA
jgi:APA family basic amino acid/polyamine antiporter